MGGTMASASSGASLRVCKQLPQAHPIHKLHQQVIQAVGLAEVIDGDDVGMVEPGQRLRLAREPLGEARVFLLLASQDLQRHEAVEPRLARLIDHAHAAAAQAFQDFQLREMAGDLLHRRRRVPASAGPPCVPPGPTSAPGASVWAARFKAIRQRGQRPSGASAASERPHFPHFRSMFAFSVITP